MTKIKYLRFFIFLRNNKLFVNFLRLFLLPLCLGYNNLGKGFNLKVFLIRFSFFFFLNFFWDKYVVEPSIKKGEKRRNINREKRRQLNKKK